MNTDKSSASSKFNPSLLKQRDHCVITGKTDLEPLRGVAKFPVFMGCISSPPENDLRVDMDWSISRSSGLIQLNRPLPLDVLYPESHGSGGIGALWDKHHKAFAQFVSRSKPKSVLEIGGAHGILAREYKSFGKVPWTIIEPNPSPVEGCEAKFIKGFFDDNFSAPESYDTIVHSHVFEHIYEPNQFMQHISQFMSSGQHLIFSLPNMQEMLKRKYTNCINFEHTVFLTEDYVEYLLAKHGFRIVEKEYFREDHSIFYSTERDSSIKPTPLAPDLYARNLKIYTDYIQYHDELIADLNKRIQATDQPVYLFGAHVFAQYLIVEGLNTARITSLLDNDPAKQGKRLYGTNLMVQSPKVLKEIDRPCVILKAGFYNQEIKEDILKNINPSVTFLE